MQVLRGKDVFLEKDCREHGHFSTVVWRGEPSLDMWRAGIPEIALGENPNCPQDCGLCGEHRQKTCCALVEVTGRCNLRCKYCFADDTPPVDPPVLEIRGWFEDLVKNNRTFVHISGGEPTVRDDLPDIVRAAKESGCEYIQLNSNALRLATDEAYVKALADAGLSFVFMQFDGIRDEIYRELRGKPLFELKRKAIENCFRYRIGVTLVPTLVPGVNTDDIGAILRFAISMSPAVRGVHFQPVSYFGRYPCAPSDEMRITLPEVLKRIEIQTGGEIRMKNIVPSCCDHPMCGFHGDFVVMPDGLHPLTQPVQERASCCSAPSSAEKNRKFVGRRWSAPEIDCCSAPVADIKTLDGFLERVRTHGFTITAMAFQDCYNLDIERLRQCSMHVYDHGKIIPFCAKYLTEVLPDGTL